MGWARAFDELIREAARLILWWYVGFKADVVNDLFLSVYLLLVIRLVGSM